MSETLEFLRFHWSDVYEIGRRDGKYVAVSKFGKCETLTADDPGSLLRLIRQHYPMGPSERSSI
jgi:hypothetical protein